MGKNKLQVAILNAILLMGGTLAYPATAYAQDQALAYRIDAGDLENALSSFGTQSRIQLIYPPELLKGKRSGGLAGNHPPMEALRQLLQGSGLEAERVNERAVVIRKATAPTAKPQAKPAEAADATQVAEPEVKELDTMKVTGTRIRGGTSASPAIVLDEVQFQQEGFTDLGEVIRSIPQNFSGGQNPGVVTGASVGGQANSNNTGGSGLNLRGLGPDATLTLLNGRRMSYDGGIQAVDISAIPIEAVERVEIVPDGASAIYGSDAVGGVANVILKRDFDGVAMGALSGDSTDGGLTRRDYTVTAGAAWESGGLIATYKKSHQDPIFADQRSYTEVMSDPHTLYSGAKLSSGLLSVHQRLGERIELIIDALRTVRESTMFQGQPTQYFHIQPKAEISSLSPTLQIILPRGWTATANISRSQNQLVSRSFSVRTTGSTLSETHYDNETQAWEFGAEGALAELGMRELRLALGVGGRRDELYVRRVTGTTPDSDAVQRNRYAYGELRLPLVGVDNARPGMRRLELSAAARSEDYDSFGRVTTPQLGVLYDPSPDFTLKATWGRSFKAPTLFQMHGTSNAILDLAQRVGCDSCTTEDTALISLGANRDLDPERARTWTTTLVFHPERFPSLHAELSYFAIDYTQRVIQPIPLRANSLRDPVYAPLVQWNPSLQQQQQVLADFSDLFSNLAGVPYDPSAVIAIISAQQTNASREKAKGVDLTGRYRLDLASGRVEFRGGVSWLDMSRQTFSDQENTDLAGTLYFPGNWKGRFGAVWSRENLSAAIFANYTSGVENGFQTRPRKTASFTTFDTTLRYASFTNGKPLSGITLALSVNNLFNRAPPVFINPNPNHAPYDSTNYSAIGRYLTISVGKHW